MTVTTTTLSPTALGVRGNSRKSTVMVGRLSEASVSLDRSAQVAEGLVAQRSENPDFRRTLAVTTLEQSDVLYQRVRTEESLRSASRAADLLRGLAGCPAEQAHPLDPLLVAVALIRVGAARLELGEPDEALKAYDEAAERLRSMLKRGDDANLRHFLARTLLEQAKAFRIKRDADEQSQIYLISPALFHSQPMFATPVLSLAIGLVALFAGGPLVEAYLRLF